MRKIKFRSTAPKKHRILLTVTVIAVIAAIIGTAGVYVAAEAGSDKILRNVYVDGIRVGGMSPGQAEEVLEKAFAGRRINVALDDGSEKSFTLDELGLMYKTNVIVGEAFSLGKSKNFAKNVLNICTSFFAPTKLSSSKSLVAVEPSGELTEFVESYAIAPTDSKFELVDGKVVITNGMNGREVDVDKLLSIIENAKSFEDVETVQAPVNVVPFTLLNVDEIYRSVKSEPNAPYGRNSEGDITATVKVFDLDHAKEIQAENSSEGESYEFLIDSESVEALEDGELYPDIVGEMTTQFDTSYSTRVHNIKIAAKNINGTELLPGETFSFNDVNGEITDDEGYQVAKGYANGTVVDSVGAGVCQVSSTLYNAALNADLEIVKRSNHSLPVAYLPLGQDAAISYPNQDFKFKNSYDAPIKIVAEVNGGDLTVRVYGQKSDAFTDVKIVNNTVSVIEPKVRETVDGSLKPGERVTSKTGSRGYVVESYRIVYKDGVEIRRDSLGRSTYKAQDREVRVGPEPRESLDEESDGDE